MKIAARIAFCSIVLLASVPLFADNGPSATGGFHFSSGDQPVDIEFEAKRQNNGSIKGHIKFSGDVELSDQDVDGEGLGPSSGPVHVTLTVNVDCLNVNGNQAAMSGVIEDSNIDSLIGNRALLAVQDNGEGSKAAPDLFTWGIYGTPDLTWVASDAELEFDEGVGLTWIATDFEREDDIGIPSHPSTEIGCETFAFGAYALEELGKGGGNIQVHP